MSRFIRNQPLKHVIFGFIAVTLLFTAGGVTGQVPTSEQLRQLQQLTPQQREQLLQALGEGATSSNNQSGELQNTGPLVVPSSSTLPLADANQEDVFAPFDSLVIELSTDNDYVPEFEEVRAALGRNVYRLDHQGFLNFPGVGNLLLAGLTADQAQLRLTAVAELAQLEILVDRLPVNKVGSVALKPYGYDLFSGVPTTFAPATDIPVPVDYVVGPGDLLVLQMFGQQNAEYRLVIGRDGQVNIPEIGPVAVAGMQFNQLREELTKQIEERYIGVTLSLTLGELRSIRVFVLGDVNRPGSYTVSGLSTMTNALFVSGGIAESGSMRNVQLKRSNRVVGTLDLYDLLLKGNTKGDKRMQPGDVIYVPPVGPQVAVFGEVNRPAIYELNSSITLQDAIALAGGILPSANQSEITIEGFGNQDGKTVRVTDLKANGSQRVMAGDQIEVIPSISRLSDGVYLRGHVKREATRQWRPGMRLLDVMPNPNWFKVQADQSYLLIRREFQSTGLIQLLSADWRAAFENPAAGANVGIEAGDTIHVFSLANDRAAKIAPFIDEIEAQATSLAPANTVEISGRVRAPGEYPFEPNMRVSDLIRAAGSTKDNAYLVEAELTRTYIEASGRDSKHVPVNLEEAMAGGEDDKLLKPYDVLTVKEIPLWRERQQVEVVGEIKFPGSYSASRGERLSEVIKRAGGLTPMAFTKGTVFLREDLKERERVQVERLTRRLRAEVAAFEGVQSEARTRAVALLRELERSEPVGRLVIDLNLALQGNPEHDVVLEDGDRLIIPPNSQEITVIGEVQYPTSHIFESNLDQSSYLYKSGGVTRNADVKRIYIIRADGNVVAQQGGNWFRRNSASVQINPGDTIVVPFDTDRISKLTLWQNVSQIVYNIGVSAAAVASF